MKTDPFHFPRKELTEHILGIFKTNIASSKTLFAPRRMGKTEFITMDLEPAACKAGYRVIYCNFWGNENNPVLALLDTVESALEGDALWERTKRLGNSKINAVKLGITGIKASIGGLPVKDDQITNLVKVLTLLSKEKKKTFFLLDEVQHLATRPEFEPLVSALRTIFDTNQDKLNVIYTGSSREGLQRLFNRRKSALFKASSQIDLPQLGRDFVRYEMNAYKNATGRSLSEALAWNTFKKLHYIPRDFRELLESCMHHIIEPRQFKSFVAEFLKEKSNDIDYLEKWNKLKAIDKLILGLLASKNDISLYSEETKHKLADSLGVEIVANHTIQNSVTRMRDKGILVKLERGDVEFEDAYFQSWCAENIGLDIDQ